MPINASRPFIKKIPTTDKRKKSNPLPKRTKRIMVNNVQEPKYYKEKSSRYDIVSGLAKTILPVIWHKTQT